MKTPCYACKHERRKTQPPYCGLTCRPSREYDQTVECVNFEPKKQYEGKKYV